MEDEYMEFIKRTVKHIFKRSSPKTNKQNNKNHQKEALKSTLQGNIQKVKETLGNSSDLIIREFNIGQKGEIEVSLLFTEGLVDKSILQEIMESLMFEVRESRLDRKVSDHPNLISFLKEYVITIGEINDVEDFETLFTAVLSGDTVILIDGYAQGLIASTKGWESRGVEEPTAQTVIRGPKEGFTENLRTNTSLIRRKIKSADLWLETKSIGRFTKTNVAIMYIQGIVNNKVIAEVHERLDRIDIDGILESGYIEELIQDETYTPFPTIYNTERPDVVAAGLLEGRIAIIVDGTPFALIVPTLFTQFFQASEDYYQRADIGTFLRMLRFVAFFIALLAPSLYIAIITFHQEMLPTQLLISLAAQREGVPFPAFIEALLMEITFEILREAGVRMPRAVGQAISIVGALVLGQAAVEAGLISSVMVIVVSITAISNFVLPAFNIAIAVRILRFVFMFLAASFGLFGITVGIIAMVLHLCSLRSFGIPYLTPMAPFNLDGQKDTLFRVPHWGLFSRPRLISQRNVIREQNSPTSKTNPNEHN